MEIMNLNNSFFKLQKTLNLLKNISNETNPNCFTERFLVAQSKFKNVLTKNMEFSEDIIEENASSNDSKKNDIYQQIFSNDSNLIKLDLSYQNLGGNGAEMLCSALKNNTVISHLYLSCLKDFLTFLDNKLSNGVSIIGNFMENNKTIQLLDLSCFF
jgi:hypothetical protein